MFRKLFYPVFLLLMFVLSTNALADLLGDPDLFSQNPVKFQKATEALVERQAKLDAAETEWLTLEEKAAG